jgi:hypothetical protein
MSIKEPSLWEVACDGYDCFAEFEENAEYGARDLEDMVSQLETEKWYVKVSISAMHGRGAFASLVLCPLCVELDKGPYGRYNL